MAESKFSRWLSHGANVATFGSLIPAGVIAVIGGYLSAGVGWIRHFGAFGIFMSALVAFFVSAVAFAVIARTKLWRLEARIRARTIGSSSPFDPMAQVYEGKRLYVRDLAPAGRRFVRNKKFIRCEIIGPATIVLGLRSKDTLPFPDIRNNIFNEDCDFIEIDPKRDPKNAVAFVDCDFDGCTLWSLNLLWLERVNESWNWITKPTNQPKLDISAPEQNRVGVDQGPAAGRDRSPPA